MSYEVIMKCECCGKRFYQEFYEGGYIDHVTNFSSHAHDWYKNAGAERIAHDVIFDGNEIRDVTDIHCRYRCVMTWTSISDDVRDEIKRIVLAMLKEIKDADKIADKIKNSNSKLVIARLEDDTYDDCYMDVFEEIVKGE